MNVLNNRFLSILCLVSLLEICISSESIGMMNEEETPKGVSRKENPEMKDTEELSREDFAKVFLERLYKHGGKPLNDGHAPHVDVYDREDKIWINSDGKRILLE